MKSSSPVRPGIAWAILLVLLLPVLGCSVQAAEKPSAVDTLKAETSLGFVPADVSIYMSMHNGAELIDRIVGSNAAERFQEIPSVSMGLMLLKMQMNNPQSNEFMRELAKPENQEAVALIRDMFSQEAFLYGNENWEAFYGVANEVNAKIYSRLPMNMDASGEPDERMQNEMIELATEALEDVDTPTLVAGFRITDAKRAQSQIDRIEKLLRPQVDSVDEIRGSLGRTKVGDSRFLTLALDGTMLPWEELMEKEAPSPEQRRLIKKLAAGIKKRTLVVAMGVWRDYVLLWIGPDLDGIATLGEGPLLVDQPELAPLVQHADGSLLGVSYVSGGFIRNAGLNGGTVDIYAAFGKGMAEAGVMQGELDEEMAERLAVDIDMLAEDLKGLIPKAGPVMAFSQLTDRGLDSYQYNWGENQFLDASKRLSLLDHVGGDPLVYCVGRGQYRPQDFEMLVRWLKRAAPYVDELTLKEIRKKKERRQYQQVKKILVPALAEIEKALRKSIIPAMRDGQSALVIDSTDQGSRLRVPPPVGGLLTLPDVGLVMGVSDSEKLERGVGQCITTVEQTWEELRKIDPENTPPLQIPEPQVETTDLGTLWSYPVPPMDVFDDRLAPNAGLSDNVLVLSTTPDFTKRLLTPTPATLDGALAGMKNRPMGAAVRIDVAGLIDAGVPWVEMGVRASIQQSMGNFDNDFDELQGLEFEDIDEPEEEVDPFATPVQPQASTGTIGSIQPVSLKPRRPANDIQPDHEEAFESPLNADLIEILKCLRTITSATYVEDEAVVTHQECHFQDLPSIVD